MEKKQILDVKKRKREYIMNLLSYTKKLTDKIKFYDALAKKPIGSPITNPFAKPVNITIVWIEENHCED